MKDNPNKWLDAGISNMLKKPAYAKANTTILKNMLPQKMSAALLDIAKPLLEVINLSDERVTRSAIMVAVAIWNYSIITDKKAPSKPVIETVISKIRAIAWEIRIIQGEVIT